MYNDNTLKVYRVSVCFIGPIPRNKWLQLLPIVFKRMFNKQKVDGLGWQEATCIQSTFIHLEGVSIVRRNVILS